MDELKKFKKKHKLTKKQKERVEMWVESGHSAYDTRWWDELEQEEALDELLCGLTDKQKDYVCLLYTSDAADERIYRLLKKRKNQRLIYRFNRFDIAN